MSSMTTLKMNGRSLANGTPPSLVSNVGVYRSTSCASVLLAPESLPCAELDAEANAH